MDSTGFSALVIAQKRMTARPDSKLYIVAPNKHLRKIFTILGLDNFSHCTIIRPTRWQLHDLEIPHATKKAGRK